jgi:hypothetical protein
MPAFSAPVAYEWRSAPEGDSREPPAAARRSNRCLIVSALWVLPPALSRTAADDNPAFVDSDLAGVEVDGRPFETTDVAAAHSGGQFEQEERRKPVLLRRHQQGDLVRLPPSFQRRDRPDHRSRGREVDGLAYPAPRRMYAAAVFIDPPHVKIRAVNVWQ